MDVYPHMVFTLMLTIERCDQHAHRPLAEIQLCRRFDRKVYFGRLRAVGVWRKSLDSTACGSEIDGKSAHIGAIRQRVGVKNNGRIEIDGEIYGIKIIKYILIGFQRKCCDGCTGIVGGIVDYRRIVGTVASRQHQRCCGHDGRRQFNKIAHIGLSALLVRIL